MIDIWWYFTAAVALVVVVLVVVNAFLIMPASADVKIDLLFDKIREVEHLNFVVLLRWTFRHIIIERERREQIQSSAIGSNALSVWSNIEQQRRRRRGNDASDDIVEDSYQGSH